MAHALIQYKQRQRREREERGASKRAAPDAQPDGAAVVVVRAVATTQTAGAVEAALCVALRIPHAKSEEDARRSATTHAYWHHAVGRPPGGLGERQAVGERGTAELLRTLDTARRIVVYGEDMEMEALRALYDGNSARWAAHQQKSTIVRHEAARTIGRQPALREVLRANAESTAEGQAGDATRWWWDGRAQAILDRSRQEVRALARVAMAKEARLPGKHATTALSVRQAILCRAGKRNRKRPRDGQLSNTRSQGGRSGDSSALFVGSGNGPEVSPRKRQRTGVPTYDETARRSARKRKVVYLDTGSQRERATKDNITAGAATLDRTVGQRYNWRDSGMEAVKRRRGRALFEATERG